jgi:redox-sensing transcriptional repressor
MSGDFKPSRASAARLSLYLRCLEGWERAGRETTSSLGLAEALGIGDAQVRKDLALLGGLGRRGVGYRVANLIQAIRIALGIDRRWSTVLVGAGNLGRALLRYQGFSERGFRIVGIFDNDPRKIGQKIEDLEVFDFKEFKERTEQLEAKLAIVAVPSEGIEEVVKGLTEAGIQGVLNFAPTMLRLPEGTPIVNVDLTIQLEQLAFQIRTGSED